MDVETILRDRNELWDNCLFITGALRATFKFGPKMHDELIWVVQGKRVTGEFQNSLLIVKPGLVNLLDETISPWLGPFPYNDNVELSATLSKSPDARFPAALTNITALRMERQDKVQQFIFSS